MSLKKASSLHNIGHVTSKRHVNGLLQGQPIRGLSSKEECPLVNYIVYSQQRALPLTVLFN